MQLIKMEKMIFIFNGKQLTKKREKPSDTVSNVVLKWNNSFCHYMIMKISFAKNVRLVIMRGIVAVAINNLSY